MTSDLGDRFWSKVEKTDDCWLWQARKNEKGYGQFWLESKTRLAHRVSYQAYYGVTLRRDEVLLHRCDTPACVRPDHLKVGTVEENNEDKLRKGRQCRGSKVASSVFSEDEVMDIRELKALGFGVVEISRAYGVHHSTVGRILQKKNWTHV